ncbi:MAG: hypothetical protein ACU0AX_07680, partial [Roseovarius sp.]|uniref:hypothetical protein n=1 Tax=Roseovarius sp. TaxID=1486281 RepID=UPI0040598D93
PTRKLPKTDPARRENTGDNNTCDQPTRAPENATRSQICRPHELSGLSVLTRCEEAATGNRRGLFLLLLVKPGHQS